MQKSRQSMILLMNFVDVHFGTQGLIVTWSRIRYGRKVWKSASHINISLLRTLRFIITSSDLYTVGILSLLVLRFELHLGFGMDQDAHDRGDSRRFHIFKLDFRLE